MLRTLLGDRFKLAMHLEARKESVEILVVDHADKVPIQN
jgi:hypothetical protein